MIAALVSSPAAHCVMLFNLSVYRLESGKYVVVYKKTESTSFDDPMLAAADYLVKRHEMKLGFDHEH